jgi:hypothetical protein
MSLEINVHSLDLTTGNQNRAGTVRARERREHRLSGVPELPSWCATVTHQDCHRHPSIVQHLTNSSTKNPSFLVSLFVHSSTSITFILQGMNVQCFERCCDLTLAWDCAACTCKISMPAGHIEHALQRFQHASPRCPEHSPPAWQKAACGAKTQHASPPDTSVPLNAANVKWVQEVLGTFLCCAHAVDSTMLAAIGTLASQQHQGTCTTMIV